MAPRPLKIDMLVFMGFRGQPCSDSVLRPVPGNLPGGRRERRRSELGALAKSGYKEGVNVGFLLY